MSRPRILVIDDSEDIRQSFRILLEQVGYEARTARDGEEGLEVTRTFRPDLIITDLSMPRMDGLEFLIRLRSDIAPPIPSVIVCSGFDTTADEALRLGAACFVAKPIEPAALLSIVAQLLEGQAPDASTLVHEQAFARRAGSHAAETAGRAMATLALRTPDLEGVFTRLTQRIADYFEIAPACIAVLDGEDLKVIAASRLCSVPAGARFTGTAQFSTSILAAKSSLVLPDARAFGPLSLTGPHSGLVLGFLVAVPLVFEDVPIGAFVLVAPEPQPFSAEDLTIVESVGRLTSQQLGEDGPLGERIELWPPSLFDGTLTAELSGLHRERGGLDLLLLDVDPRTLHSDLVSALLSRGGPRFSVSPRGAGTLAICKRDSNADSATSLMSSILSTISTTGTVRAAGWVSLIDDGLPQVPSDLVFQLAARALDQARSNPGRPIERIVGGSTPPPLWPTRDASL